MASALVEQTYDRLINLIIETKLKPGDKLPSEMTLCELFEVSRNTLRAALNKLDVLGVTETRQGGGTCVRELDSNVHLNFLVPAVLTHNSDLLEIMYFRKGIEVEATRLAAERATPEDIERLKTLMINCKDSLNNMEQFASANTDFHYSIAVASHNKMFEKMMEIIRSMILQEMQNFLIFQGEDIDSTFYHDMVLRCIIDHKPDEAAFFMDKHVELVISRVREYMANSNRELKTEGK